MNILIASQNVGKIEGITRTFKKYFDDVCSQGFKISSNVSDQPINDETYVGVCNRLNNLEKYAEENNINADYFVASESGIFNTLGKWMTINLILIKEKSTGILSEGTSRGLEIPDKYIEEIKKSELGVVVDKIFEGKGIKQNMGAIGFLTKGEIKRTDLVSEATEMAIIPFINENEKWKNI